MRDRLRRVLGGLLVAVSVTWIIGVSAVYYLYYARRREEGKKLTWMDGVRAIGTLARIRLTSSQRLFGAEDTYHRQRLAELAARPRLPELPGERGTEISSRRSDETPRA